LWLCFAPGFFSGGGFLSLRGCFLPYRLVYGVGFPVLVCLLHPGNLKAYVHLAIVLVGKLLQYLQREGECYDVHVSYLAAFSEIILLNVFHDDLGLSVIDVQESVEAWSQVQGGTGIPETSHG